MTRGAATGIGKGELRIGPAADQPEHAQRFVARHLVPLLDRLFVALDLGGDGVAQAEPLRHHLAGQFLEPVVEGGIEVSQRLEEAERDQGGNGGSFCHVMAITK